MLSLIIHVLALEGESLKYSVDMLLSCILFCDTRLGCFIVWLIKVSFCIKLVEKGETDNFGGLCFYSKLAEFLHAAFISVEKNCPVIFFHWVICSLFSKNNVCKNPQFSRVASFVDVLLIGQQKTSFVLYEVKIKSHKILTVF